MASVATETASPSRPDHATDLSRRIRDQKVESPRWLGLSRERWIRMAVLLVVVGAVLFPLVPVAIQAFLDGAIYLDTSRFTVDNFVRMFTVDTFGQVILNSLALAVLTAMISMTLAVLLSIALVRVRIPGSRWMSNLILWPIFISPLVLAFGFGIVYGPSGYVSAFATMLFGSVPWNLYSIPGMAVMTSVAVLPLGFLYCSNAVRMIDPALENAARICGSRPGRTIWRIIVPMMRPAALYATLLIFTSTFEELSIPLLYGSPVGIDTFGSFLYSRGFDKAQPDYGILGASALFILVILILLMIVQSRALRNSRRFVMVRGRGTRTANMDIGRARWLVAGLIALYLLISTIIPMIGLIARAFTLILSPLVSPIDVLTITNFTAIFDHQPYVDSIRNSILIALIGAVATTIIMLVAVLVARRSSFRFRGVVEVASLSPQAIPGTIIGVGIFWGILSITPLASLNGTVLILVLAFCLCAFPIAFGAIAPQVIQIGHELDQAARISGADWWKAMTRIIIRLLVPALLTSFILVFTQLIKTYSPAVFLGSGGAQVIGSTSLTLWGNGNTGPVAALSCIQIAIILVVVFIARKVLKVNIHA